MKNMFFKKIFILLSLILFLSPIVFSSFLSLENTPDNSLNTFYISKNHSKQIFFKVLPFSDLNNYKIVYDFKVYSDNLKEIDLSLSKKEEIFISPSHSYFSLNIRSLNFINQTVNLKIISTIYDSLGNMIDSDYVFIKLVSNNSEYEFVNTFDKSVPVLSGYSLSRDKMILLNVYDKDSIVIKNHVNNSVSYGLDCFSDNNYLDINLKYQGNNSYILEVSVFDDNFEKRDVSIINCKSFYKNDVIYLKPIYVSILDVSYKKTDLVPVEIENNLKENKLKVFLNKIINFKIKK